jgi:cystathionine gamma-lyase
VFAAPFHLGDRPPRAGGADAYARTEHPTLRDFEAAVGELDGGRCLSFATGMAALTAVVMACAGAGDRVVLPSDGYYTTRLLAAEELSRFGVEVEYVATLDIEGVAAAGGLDGARLVLLETPSNPQLDVCDIAAVARAARAAGALVAVDNTTATPIGQTPLDHNADLVVASGTKALTGHSDLLLGYIASRDPALLATLRAWRDSTGGIPGDFEAWLAHRSLGTLDLRFARQNENAATVTEALCLHPAVETVRWPGLDSDPSYVVALKQMRRIPGVVTFTLASAEAVAKFLSASRLVTAATSFGGLHTTADRRAQWGDDAPEGLVRLSCGVEDTDDLVADILAALDTIE